MDFFEGLGHDVLQLVLLFAMPQDGASALAWLGSTSRVNKTLRVACRADALWRTAGERAHLGLPSQLFYGVSAKEACRILRAKRKEAEAMELEDYGSMDCDIEAAPQSMLGRHPAMLPSLHDALDWSRVEQSAKELLAFLRNVLTVRPTEQDAEAALLRYRLFLELQRAHPNTWLVPSADIAWAQLTHVLRTKTCWEDMERLGMTPVRRNSSHPLIPEASKATCELWVTVFGEEYIASSEPPVTCTKAFEKTRPKRVPNLDISISAKELIDDLAFYGHFERDTTSILHSAEDYGMGWDCVEDEMLRRLTRSYQRYLFLLRKYPDAGLRGPNVPTDLIWHAHQWDPVTYKEDMITVMGYHLQHRMWRGDESPGESKPLGRALDELWKQEYNVPHSDDYKYDQY